MQRTILLFDVDGVLIRSGGYREALRATLDYFTTRMGQPSLGVTDNEIALFEACGMTNEWDSIPLAVSIMLVNALSERPDLVRDNLADTMAAIRESGIRLARPDFAPLAHEVMAQEPSGARPNPALLPVMRTHADRTIHHLLDELLGNVNSVHTPTTHIFQNYVLGSERFTQTYKMPAEMETESYLIKYDKSHILPEMTRRLLDRVAAEGWYMTVFSARPSLPPTDLSPADYQPANPKLYPPEGELAAELLGLNGRTPFITWGRVAWLAEKHGKEMGYYVKPSPVHALASIGAALTGQEVASLEAAYTFVEQERVTGPLTELESSPVRVVVFEDAVPGIWAGQRAVERLRRAGLDVTFEGVGISSEANKKETLRAIAGFVADDINEALERYLM